MRNQIKAIVVAVIVIGVIGSKPAEASNHIIYLHGRSMTAFPSSSQIPQASLPTGWSGFNPAYNGNQHLYDDASNTTIKNALLSNCRGNENCIVIAHSAGFNRLTYALNQLAVNGTPATNLLYVSAIASAGGGTPIARKASKGLVKFLAKLFGQYSDIDGELWDTQWSTAGQYANLQNLAVPVWHVGGGTADTCIRIRYWFFRLTLCGNENFPTVAGVPWGDGIVPMWSACGYQNQVGYTSCSDSGTKYTNRYWDTFGSYNYPGTNHMSMLAKGMRVAAQRAFSIIFTPINTGTSISSTNGGFPSCNPASNDCDLAESAGINWFYVYANAINAQVANYRPQTCYNGYCGTTTLGSVISVTDFYRTVFVPGETDYEYTVLTHEFKWIDPYGATRYCVSDNTDPVDVVNPLSCPTSSQIPPPPPPDPCAGCACGCGGDY